MNWAGKMISVDELAPQVYTPGMRGSLQTDLLSASRRQGLMAIPIQGLPSLMAEVAAGHPVIVFENLALSWAPQWHYAIIFGYDLSAQEVIMHSGPQAFKRWDMSRFERSWMLADYWGLVVLPPDELSKTANEMAHLTAASGLEQAGRKNEAEIAYERILWRWPGSLGALIGLGNLKYEKKEYSASIWYLQQAIENYPDSAIAWHNLAIAQADAKMKSKAHDSALRALQFAPASALTAYIHNLQPLIDQ
jgi:tetratricopeptide (TPR) repeat protein